MTDIKLSRLLSDLEASASKLNAESDSLNAVLEAVEAKLVARNVGLETWLDEGVPSFHTMRRNTATTTMEMVKEP